jgi:hypothetical protein
MHHLETIRPRTVIFGGWSPHYEPFLERARANGPRYVVYWTSSAGQTEMAGELQKYLRIIDDARVAEVLYADARLARSPAARLTPADFLPVCALPPAKHRRVVRAKPRGARVVSLFFSSGEARRKNPFTAFLALGGLQDKYVLHLNGLSRHAPYRRLLGKLEIPFRDFGWMERAVYERALEDVDLGLQLSFAESYNQVAADHFLRGIPVVVSEMIPLLNNVDPSLRAKLVVSNPDDPTAVRRRSATYWRMHACASRSAPPCAVSSSPTTPQTCAPRARAAEAGVKPRRANRVYLPSPAIAHREIEGRSCCSCPTTRDLHLQHRRELHLEGTRASARPAAHRRRAGERVRHRQGAGRGGRHEVRR